MSGSVVLSASSSTSSAMARAMGSVGEPKP